MQVLFVTSIDRVFKALIVTFLTINWDGEEEEESKENKRDEQERDKGGNDSATHPSNYDTSFRLLHKVDIAFNVILLLHHSRLELCCDGTIIGRSNFFQVACFLDLRAIVHVRRNSQ